MSAANTLDLVEEPTMSTTTVTRSPRRAAKPRPANTCKLTLEIRGTAYGVKPIPCSTGRAWRLRNHVNGNIYDVVETEDGPECDCADAVYRHGDGGTFCKHIKALSVLNLITLDFACDPRTWPAWTGNHTYAPGR
jgi:hypothetical protein